MTPFSPKPIFRKGDVFLVAIIMFIMGYTASSCVGERVPPDRVRTELVKSGYKPTRRVKTFPDGELWDTDQGKVRVYCRPAICFSESRAE